MPTQANPNSVATGQPESSANPSPTATTHPPQRSTDTGPRRSVSRSPERRPAAIAQEKMRITLDTNPTHVRNKGVEVFAEELKKRVGNKIVVEIYPSGQLFRDRDVPKALRQGAVEMAVPGTWQLDGVEPVGLQHPERLETPT